MIHHEEDEEYFDMVLYKHHLEMSLHTLALSNTSNWCIQFNNYKHELKQKSEKFWEALL